MTGRLIWKKCHSANLSELQGCPKVQNHPLDPAAVLNEPDPQQKINLTRMICRELESQNERRPFSLQEQGPLSCTLAEHHDQQHSAHITPFDMTAMPERFLCLPKMPARPRGMQIVDPDAMPKRKSLRNLEGLLALLHALAQIELSAIEIDLAMLHLYPDAPHAWQLDMISIILDECEHFELLCSTLSSRGWEFGSLAVHHALWFGFLKGASWLEHMAIATRYQEAHGVDASHLLLQSALGSPDSSPLQEVLPIIHRLHSDEIRHVAIGSKWWHWSFRQNGVSPCQQIADERACDHFFRLIESTYEKPWSKRFPFYLEGRILAGFNPFEIERFAKIQLEKDRVNNWNTSAQSRQKAPPPAREDLAK